mgnify:CR=1 FL=1
MMATGPRPMFTKRRPHRHYSMHPTDGSGCRAISRARTGTATALLLLTLTIGVRGDLGSAIFTWSFWMKWLYTIALIVIGVMLSLYFARPDNHSAKVLWWLLLPFVLLALLAAYQLNNAPQDAIHFMWMGHSACIYSISLELSMTRSLGGRNRASEAKPF